MLHRLLALLLAAAAASCAAAAGDALRTANALLAQHPAAPLRLDTAAYNALTAPGRPFALLVVLTALGSNYNCVPCKNFNEQLGLVAASWNKLGIKDTLYVASLDFEDGKEVFQSLAIQSVPNVFFFPANTGPFGRKDANKEDYNLQRRGSSAEDVARFLEQYTRQKIPIARPVDYANYIVSAVILVVLVAAGRVLFAAFGAVLMNKALWMIASITVIVFMCAGYMWNVIRSPPYAGQPRDGRGIGLFASGFSSQYVVESQIMGVMYTLTGVAFIALGTKVPRVKGAVKQGVAVTVGITAFIVLYSALLYSFRLKQGGYPFRLLF